MSSVDMEFLAEAREATVIAGKRFAENMGAGPTLLVSAGCPKGCDRCTRECAVRWIKFRVWEKMWLEEEALLLAEAKEATVQ